MKDIKIIRIGHLAKGTYGCAEPYAEILYNGQAKQLNFPCNTNLENKKTVQIKIQRGLFGFDVITDQIVN